MEPNAITFLLNQEQIEKLVEGIKTHITKELSKIKIVEEPMTIKEAANYLRCSQRTLHERKRKGDIPFHRIDGQVLFLPSELHQFIKNS